MRRELGIPATIGSFSFSEPGFGVKDWALASFMDRGELAGIYLWLSEMTPALALSKNNGATNKT